MPIKNLTLGLCLLLSGTALAENKTYRVREGDTLSGIANRFHVRKKSIARANGLKGEHLRVGRSLEIPNATIYSDRRSSARVPSGYVVRNGDFDWIIAKRHHITVSQLHNMNPGVDFDSLQVGSHLRVPSGGDQVARHASSHKSKGRSVGTYVIRNGDNDWIIAHRAGIRISELKAMNPKVRWARIQPGDHINLPGSSVAVSSSKSSHVRSRYAVITGDNVTIRRKASRSSEAITRVDGGTRVTVLGHDGDWYELRFPKGTVGWVRGDLLKSTSAPRHEVARSSSRRRRHHSEYVASRRHRRRHHLGGLVANNIDSDGNTVLEATKEFRNARYSWGAMSRHSTDCSGFAKQVYGKVGVNLPRTSSEQSGVGQKVDRNHLKAGDLVFFHTSRRNRVTHVGIYVGKGKFIHASSGGGKVQVNSLNEGYYHDHFVTARHLAKADKKKK